MKSNTSIFTINNHLITLINNEAIILCSIYNNTTMNTYFSLITPNLKVIKSDSFIDLFKRCLNCLSKRKRNKDSVDDFIRITYDQNRCMKLQIQATFESYFTVTEEFLFEKIVKIDENDLFTKQLNKLLSSSIIYESTIIAKEKEEKEKEEKEKEKEKEKGKKEQDICIEEIPIKELTDLPDECKKQVFSDYPACYTK